jgi:sortase family protein
VNSTWRRAYPYPQMARSTSLPSASASVRQLGDSASDGPSVFYRLGALNPGDLLGVTLADRQVAVFKVTGVRLYPKDRFPTSAVYGDTGYAALRLITCRGGFDTRDHHYLSNVVAFASLVSSHPAHAGRDG